MITQELILKLFHYDPLTGILKRIGRLKSNGDITPCDFVGSAKSTHGYLQYTVKNKTYDCHRLIFLYMEGEFPNCDVDHIDGDRTNNKWENLRKVTREENLRNVGMKNTPRYGVTGVGIHNPSGCWRVWISYHQKSGFKSFEEAVAYRKMKEKEMGFTEQHFNREVWSDEV